MATVNAKEVLVQRFDAAEVVVADQWKPLCFGTAALTGTNEILTEKIRNCLDASQPLQTVSEYGAQSFTMTLAGIFDNDAAALIELNWFINQEKPQLRALIPGFAYINCDEWLIGQYGHPGKLEGSLECDRNYTSSGVVSAVPV